MVGEISYIKEDANCPYKATIAKQFEMQTLNKVYLGNRIAVKTPQSKQ